MTTDDIRRPNYAEGQYLAASDFVAEQQYHRDAFRRSNLTQHTWGIFAGLEFDEQPQAGTDQLVDVFIKPGMAVDGFGRPVVVFYPHKLDPGMFQQPQFATDGWVQVWIRYGTEQTNPAKHGYEVCSSPGLMYRTHEIFCIDIGTIVPTHDEIVVAGQGKPDPKLPYDLSVPEQVLPEDEERLQWRIPLGWVHWNGSDGFVKSQPPDEAQRMKGRKYGGAIADEILAQGGLLRIADRRTESPLRDGEPGAAVMV